MKKAKLFDIKEMQWREDKNELRSCVFKPSKKMTMQYWEIKPGAGAPVHSHPHEQLIYIQQGVLEVTCEDVKYDVGAGCFCYIPPEANHSTFNPGPEYCINIDVFVPERMDRQESTRVKDLGHKNWK